MIAITEVLLPDFRHQLFVPFIFLPETEQYLEEDGEDIGDLRKDVPIIFVEGIEVAESIDFSFVVNGRRGRNVSCGLIDQVSLQTFQFI